MAAPYSFRTVWRVDALPDRVWRALTAAVTGRSASWWRAMRVVSPARRIDRGEQMRAEVHAPLGYRLRLVLTLTRVRPGHAISAESSGDLEGRGSVEVRREGAGSEVRFAWDVEVRRRWMRLLDPVLRPVFAVAHRMVMRAGERGLREALHGAPRSARRKPANPVPRGGGRRHAE
ncbi:hypothetical protein [Microbacterium marinilacus]|uniref:Polyketide cyclase n=1 Tax=Microbacterium marinilacus TaxID=415209 RepID=A0ABP7BH48_9MICO|nr:hypothetical protein [Microbacterium marinilacus]MBY0688487.1 hypothetical protein [Microbacterium marinilacus]